MLAGMLVVLLLAIVLGNLVLCDAELVPVPAPTGWEHWPTLPGLGPFTLTGEREPCVGHHIQCGLSETELRDRRVCPRCGVSLDAWYGPRGIYGTARDVELRVHEGTYAVVARESELSEPKLVVAFEREKSFTRPSLSRHPTEAFFVALALVVLAAGAVVAWRAERRAVALEDRARYRPATVEGGRVILDDDAEAYVLSDATVPPGRVLVRERPRTTTDYRTTRTLDASDLVRIDPAIVRELAASQAANARQLAFAIAVACATVAGVEAAGTWVHDSHILDLD